MSLDNVVLTIGATFVIPDSSPTVWVMNGGVGDRVVRLPTLSTDRQVVLANVGTTNELNVTDSNGVALVDIPASAVGMFFAGTNRWVWFTKSLASDIISSVVMVGSGNIAATDIEVQVNSAGVAVLTLPSSITWNASVGWRGFPLTVFDISGAASTNNITINPAVGQNISGFSTVPIATDYGVRQFRPRDGGGWVLLGA